MSTDKKRKTNLICPLTKRFESIYVCALNCKNKCQLYVSSLDIGLLEEYVQTHPEFEIRGELMATTKKTVNTDSKNIKYYWVIDDDDKVEEVTEQEIKGNPQLYLDKEIWDKPPNEYELVVTLKRKK